MDEKVRNRFLEDMTLKLRHERDKLGEEQREGKIHWKRVRKRREKKRSKVGQAGGNLGRV